MVGNKVQRKQMPQAVPPGPTPGPTQIPGHPARALCPLGFPSALLLVGIPLLVHPHQS